MLKNYPGETWKEVTFDFEFTNEYRLEVSNYGRIRSFNKQSDGDEVKGSMINGYRIVRLKFFKPRKLAFHTRITSLQEQILKLNEKINSLKQAGAAEASLDEAPLYEAQLDEAVQLLSDAKKKLATQFKHDTKDRTIHYQSLIHKLVAEHFCKKPSDKHTVVGHLDFDKLNNRSFNLKWMTPEENYIHQGNSPRVIAGKEVRKNSKHTKVAKLTITKVMLLKKMLNLGKPMRTLVKQFKITDTQILRIKRGENWAHVPAAN